MAAAEWESNNSTVITKLIQAGVSVNAVSQCEKKTSALHLACQFSTVETIRALIDNGAKVNLKCGCGDLPIHRAALCGIAANVAFVISRGADIHAFGQQGMTTLMSAIEDQNQKKQCIEIMKLLVKAGVLVNTLSGTADEIYHVSLVQKIARTTALHYACLLAKLDCVKFLIKQGADVNITNGLGDQPLHMAVDGDSIEISNILLQSGAQINAGGADGVTSLCLAAMEANTEFVSFLIENKADANIGDSDGQLPLHKAAKHCNPCLIRLLLPHTSDINSKDDTGCTALHLASGNGLPDSVALLLKKGSGVDIQNDLGNTSVHITAQEGHYEILHILQIFKANLHIKNYSGETATFASCSRLNLKMVEFLVICGCDPLTTDNMGSNLLHAVIQSDFHAMLLKIIFEPLKADEQAYKVLGMSKLSVLRVENEESNDFSFVYSTSLGRAQQLIEENNYDKLTRLQPLFVTIIDRLLSLGLDINATDYNQQTPLHLAAGSGFLTAVVYLVEKGANVMARDKFGYIPLFLSIEHSQVFKYLMKKSEDLVEVDYKQVARLAHFHSLPKVLRKCQSKFRELISFEAFPQKVRTQWLKLSANEDLMRKMPIWMTTLQPLTYVNHDDMIYTVTLLLKDLESYMKEEDEQLAFEAQRCGSEEEETKVMARDEQHVPCILTNVRFDMFREPTGPDPDLNTHVELICKREYRRFMRRLLDQKNRLSPSKVCKYFYGAVSIFLARAETLRKYPQIQRIMVKDVTERNHHVAYLYIRWHDDVYPLLDIAIELVPMVALHGWWPHWGNQHPLTRQIECVALPKWKLTQEIEMTAMEIGVHRWGPLFRMMPYEMKEGYRLAKVIRDKGVCPIIDDWQPASYFIDSYFMKNIIIKEFEKSLQPVTLAITEDQNHEDDDVTTENVQVRSTKSSLFWARQIYEKLEKAFDEGLLTTFLFPDYNLLKDAHFRQYKGRACHYAMLCRDLLTPGSVEHFKKAYMGL